MKEVDFWKLKDEAKKSVDQSIGWHISGPEIMSANQLIDLPSNSIYQRLGVLVITERPGRIFINRKVLDKVKIPKESKKFFSWPLGERSEVIWVS